MRTVAAIPGKTVTPAGTWQRAVVPPPDADGGAPVPSSGALTAPTGVAPSFRAVQVNGAGPPCTSTSAVLGGASNRNWSSWVSVALMDNDPGEIEPTLSPTATTWSTSTSTALSMPPAGAVTVAVFTRGARGVEVGLPSGSVPVTWSRSCSYRISSRACPAVTLDPAGTSSLRTVPAAVALTGTASSATTLPSTETVFVTVARATGTGGEFSSSVGAPGPDAVPAESPPRNARTTSAAAMTAQTSSRSAGKTTVRTTDMHAPCCSTGWFRYRGTVAATAPRRCPPAGGLAAAVEATAGGHDRPAVP